MYQDDDYNFDYEDGDYGNKTEFERIQTLNEFIKSLNDVNDYLLNKEKIEFFVQESIALKEYRSGLFLLSILENYDSYSGEYFNFKGLCQYGLELFDDAIESFKMGLTFNPNDQELSINLANVLNEIDKTDEAKEILRKCIEINPNNIELLIKFSNVLQSEDMKVAIQFLEFQLERFPFDEDIIYELSRCYELVNNNEKVIELYKLIIENGDRSSVSYHNLGITYLRVDNYEMAIENLKKAVELDESFYSAWFNLGNAYSFDNQIDDAIKCYNEAIKLDNNDFAVWYNLGCCYEEKMEFEKAIEHLNKSLELHPNHSDSYLYIGYCLEGLGKEDLAYHNYLLAIDLDDTNYDAMYAKGDYEYFIGDYEKALETYKEVLEYDYENPELHFLLSLNYFMLKNYTQATTHVDLCIGMIPDFADAYLLRSKILLAQENLKEGIETLKIGISIDNSLAKKFKEEFPKIIKNNRFKELIGEYYKYFI